MDGLQLFGLLKLQMVKEITSLFELICLNLEKPEVLHFLELLIQFLMLLSLQLKLVEQLLVMPN